MVNFILRGSQALAHDRQLVDLHNLHKRFWTAAFWSNEHGPSHLVAWVLPHSILFAKTEDIKDFIINKPVPLIYKDGNSGSYYLIRQYRDCIPTFELKFPTRALTQAAETASSGKAAEDVFRDWGNGLFCDLVSHTMTSKDLEGVDFTMYTDIFDKPFDLDGMKQGVDIDVKYDARLRDGSINLMIPGHRDDAKDRYTPRKLQLSGN